MNFGYIFDAVRVSQPKAVIRDGTSAHAEAFSILADPARGEAAAGFRGEWGEYVCGARRSGRIWHVAGITEKLRVLTLFFPYLEEGVRYRATWTLDDGAVLPTNAVNPTPSVISAGDKAMVRMNEDGGFVLRLEPMD
ncbi:MAG: glycoside hydrolase family 97 C-terminal domain-containing protein [Kiritimatiellae bacterium]|nr:glycoside hydrolase family 97 C-terminal domain-containing protein [Kiritimatiellia bacterium]